MEVSPPPTSLWAVRAPISCSSSWATNREVSPARFAEYVSWVFPLETRSLSVILAFYLVTAPSALRFSLHETTRRNVWTLSRPYCAMSSLRPLAGTTTVL